MVQETTETDTSKAAWENVFTPEVCRRLMGKLEQWSPAMKIFVIFSFAYVLAVSGIGFWVCIRVGSIFAVLAYFAEKKYFDKKFQRDVDKYIRDPSNLGNFLHKIPSWVHSPEYEKTSWLNHMLAVLWPHMSLANESGLKHPDFMKPYKPSFLSFMRMRTADLGTSPMKVLGVKVVHPEKHKNEIVLDMDISWVAENDNITIEAGKGIFTFTAQVSDIRLRGKLRVVLHSFFDSWPCYKFMNVSFKERPELDLDLKLAGMNLGAIPGLQGMMDKALRDAVDGLVWPKEIVIPMVPPELITEGDLIGGRQLKGILHMKIVEAQLQKKKVKVRFSHRGREAQVDIKDSNTHELPPLQFVVENTALDTIAVDLGKLGKTELKVGSLELPSTLVVERFAWIETDKKNKIHVQCVWEPLVKGVPNEDPDRAPRNEGVLRVKLISARNLAAMDKIGTSDPFAKLRIGAPDKAPRDIFKKSTIKWKDCNPEWLEEHQFFVNSEETDVFDTELWDYDKWSKNDLLGKLKIPIQEVVAAEGNLFGNWTLTDQPKNAKGSMKLELHYFRRTNPGKVRALLGGEASNCAALRMLTPDLDPELSGMGRVQRGATMGRKDDLDSSDSRSSSNLQFLTTMPVKVAGIGEIHHGQIKVNLKSGHSLAPMDDNNYSDPYVLVKMAGQTSRSKMVEKTVNPVWDEEFTLGVNDASNDTVRVEVWDRDSLCDDAMGYVEVSVNEILLRGGRIDGEWPLKDIHTGSIKMDLTFETGSGARGSCLGFASAAGVVRLCGATLLS